MKKVTLYVYSMNSYKLFLNHLQYMMIGLRVLLCKLEETEWLFDITPKFTQFMLSTSYNTINSTRYHIELAFG